MSGSSRSFWDRLPLHRIFDEKFLRFLLVGVSNFLVSFSVFHLLLLVPVGLLVAAIVTGTPRVLPEQNSVPGLVNRRLARFADSELGTRSCRVRPQYRRGAGLERFCVCSSGEKFLKYLLTLDITCHYHESMVKVE